MSISSTSIRNGAVALVLLAAASGCSPDTAEQASDLEQSPLIAGTVVPADVAAESQAEGEAEPEAETEVLGIVEDNEEIAEGNEEVVEAEVVEAQVIESDEAQVEEADTSEEDALLGDTIQEDEASEPDRPSNYAIVGVPVGLNMRSGPGVENAVVIAVDKARVVTATGNQSGDWIEVTLDGSTGWMALDYLEATDRQDSPIATVEQTIDSGQYVEGGEIASAPATAETPIGVRNLIVANVTDGVNLRQGPGTEFAIVIGAPVTSIVTATGVTSGEWVEVAFNGFTGWTLGQFLNEV